VNTFVQRFQEKIKGCISGFDRIVFKGSISRLMYAAGAERFFQNQGVLNKDYKSWVMAQSKQLIEAAEAYTRKELGYGIKPIKSSKKRKEKIAHQQQQEMTMRSGLIGVWSCVEACTTYRAHYDAMAGHPKLRRDFSRCKHLYFYFDDGELGFMSIRLQTWFPFGIQIALNGREWLRRALENEGIDFVIHGNKFLHIADYEKAQELLNRQLDSRWANLLNGFLPRVFPTMEHTLGAEQSYYWSLWQSEWASDFIFDDPATLQPIMERLLSHALITGTGERVLRYMGRPVDLNGQPHPRANPELLTRVQVWHNGARIRHWVDNNSIKLYNEHNVLRAEMTINNPAMFRVFRHPEGLPKDEPKQRLPLRKGIADIAIRSQVAEDVNLRFMEQMATVHDDIPLRDILKDLTVTSRHKGRRLRALDITGKDKEPLLALADPMFVVSDITNKQLRLALKDSAWAANKTDEQLSAKISRLLRLLRDHGLIRKLPNQRKYILTAKGRTLTTALSALLAASTQQLLEIAA